MKRQPMTYTEHLRLHGGLPKMGEDATAVLEQIRDQLAKSGTTPEAVAQMSSDAAAAAAAVGQGGGDPDPAAVAAAAVEAGKSAPAIPANETPEQELSRLRKTLADHNMRESMAVVAAGVVEQTKTAQVQQQEAMAKMMREEVEKAMQGQPMSEAVAAVLKDVRAPSRLVFPGASEDFATQLEQGKGLTVQQRESVRGGVDKGVKEFMDSKSFALFMGAIDRMKRGMARDFELKALAESTDASGGFLVPPEWMSDVLALLRPATVVMAAGPRTIPIGKSLHSVALSAAGTVYWGTENAATPPSQESFTDTPLLAPHSLTALVPASNQLLRDTSRVGLEDAERIIREDLVLIMALGMDLGFLQGSGEGGQPLGILNNGSLVDVTTRLGVATNGSFFDDDIARNIVATYRTFNLQQPRLAWFFNPILINQLEGLKDNEGRYLLESGQLTVNPDQRTGTLWKIPFYTTTQIPSNLTRGSSSAATYVALVDMNNLYVGESRELTLDSSSEASYTPDSGTTWINAFQNRQTLFRAEWIGDIAHRRPSQGIVVCRGIKTE